MEIDITDFVLKNAMIDFSASVAEIGNNAARSTWNAVREHSPSYMFVTQDNREEVQSYFRDFGAWSPDEIAAWSDTDLNALLLQDIAGNVREAGLDDLSEDSSPDEIREAFAKYDADQDVSHLLFLDDDQRIYYYVGC